MGFITDDGRESFVRLMRREHVVIRCDHTDIRAALGDNTKLVIGRQRRKSMSNIGTAHTIRTARAGNGLLHLLQISLSCGRTTLAYALGNFYKGLFHGINY
jgi:hypothetical protein